MMGSGPVGGKQGALRALTALMAALPTGRPLAGSRGLRTISSLVLLLAILVPSGAAQARSHRHHAGRHCGGKTRRRHARRSCGGRVLVRKLAAGPVSSQQFGSSAGSPSDALRSACPDRTLVPAVGNLDRIATATLCLINEQRKAHGLGELAPDPALTRAAIAHNDEMINANYFDHPSADGTSAIARLAASGFVPPGGSYIVGENLGWGLGSLAAPASVVGGWMNSPEHRVNILSRAFTKSSVAVAAAVPPIIDDSGLPGATYTEDFGALG